MGMVKKTNTPVAEAAVAKPQAEVRRDQAAESGSEAALERLKTTVAKHEGKAAAVAQYKPRDFDKEARGKTRCVQFEAALMSPAIAGMQFNNMEEYLKLVRQAADAGVAYSFEE